MGDRFNKCRLCLKLGDFCSIYEEDESMKLSEMVMSFARVQILEGDGLTDRVCSSCIENLSSAYLFKLQCEKIDKLLRTEAVTNNDYDGLLNKTFHVQGSSNQNDNFISAEKSSNFGAIGPIMRDISDDTDSEVESIKCVYCDQSYNSVVAHTCHVTCTIENRPNSTGSDDTLVAAESGTLYLSANSTFNNSKHCQVSCVLCDEKYDKYVDYVDHINICTANVKLHHYVCPVCHELHNEKESYLQHLKSFHFKQDVVNETQETSFDTVDSFPIGPEKPPRIRTARRQIGWSFEDIYQEIGPAEEKITPTSSPLKTFFSKLGNETFSRHSTPRKVSFRKLIEDGKTKTSNMLPFKKYINNYKMKKKEELYSSVLPKSKRVAQLKITETVSDSDYGTTSTSEDSWKLKQNLICACDKKVFMFSEHLENQSKLTSMIKELGGVIAENTKMEMLATHFIAILPNDSYTGMMVCSLATGKWLLHVNYIYDSFRRKKFLDENLYEWTRHPKMLEIDNTSVEIAKAASYWRHELRMTDAKLPFEGMQIILVMKKKYRQYYQMIFKTLKAKALAYDPRTPGSCCSADYCFVDMRIIERVKLKFFASHNIPVFPYQYILVYLLNRGCVEGEHKYLLQDCKNIKDIDILNKTF